MNPTTATEGHKMQYQIKSRASIGREEPSPHWFANHMHSVFEAMQALKACDKPHA